MSEIGFGPTLTELCEIVQDYVQLKQLPTQFVNDYPGYDGTISFLKNVTSAYMQLQLRKIKDNHPAHNHHAAHQ